MAKLGLTPHTRPSKVQRPNSQHIFGRYPNLVEHLVVQRLDYVWVADVMLLKRIHSSLSYLTLAEFES